MKAVVSVGGSVITGALENDELDLYEEVFQELETETSKLVIVTGAGDLKRYIDSASDFQVSESWKDLIGIKATRLHAALVSSMLGGNVPIPETLEEVAALSEIRDVVVLGGLTPGQSTDAVAAEAAEIIDADRLVVATTVDGVYDEDPHASAEAERYDELGYGELLDLVSENESSAGSYPLLDFTAAKLVQRSSIETVVLDGRKPGTLSKALSEDPPGTLVR
ncbi:MAG: UMP kinase [Candidatus Nanohaloarchaea archaeon]